MSVPVTTKFEFVEQVNPEFTKCRCRVMALGKNRNGSYFSKDAVDKAMHSFANVPVIAFLYKDDEGKYHVGGHQMEVVGDGNQLSMRSLCVPYGTVLENEFSYEDVAEADGTIATYLCCSLVLWTTRFPEIMDAIYDENTFFAQSMEITPVKVERFSEDERYFDIKEFNASALCLLGKSDIPEFNVEPCFPSASVMPYSLDEHFSTLMEELKAKLTECFAVAADKMTNDGGGQDDMDENKIVNPETNDNTETFEENENVEETVVEGSETAEDTEDTQESEDNQTSESTAYELASKRVEKYRETVRALNTNEKYYYLMDYDEKYLYVSCDEFDGEAVKTKCYRAAYIDGEDVTLGEFEEIEVMWLTKDEAETIDNMRREFAAYKDSHTADNAEVEELRKFKADRLAEDHKVAVNDVLSQFTDLDGVELFEDLKKTAFDFEDVAALEEKCFAIRGRNAKVKPESTKNKDVRAPIVAQRREDESAEPYGGLFSLYGQNN